jgi:isorenieratene synthase
VVRRPERGAGGRVRQMGVPCASIGPRRHLTGVSVLWTTLAVLLVLLTAAIVSLRSRVPALIERRLGGYRRRVVRPDPDRPMAVQRPPTVAVIGGGLAGIAAAEALASGGARVTLFEADDHLGGKAGAPMRPGPDGRLVPVDHGFHAIFGHYYNLRALLARAGVDTLRPIGDYQILTRDGRRLGFRDVAKVPVLNLLSLWRQGLFSFREVGLGRRGKHMEAFLRYDAEATFARWDDTSYDTFAERAGLPDDLKLVFESFARAFFASGDRLSAAALMQSFHFYFLSHDHGLLYDFADGDAEQSLIAPLRQRLEDLGATICTSSPVASIAPDDSAYRVADQRFDRVVLATPAMVARQILNASEALLVAHPELRGAMSGVRRSQRYTVLRVWLDRPIPFDGPAFVATEGAPMLDAVAFPARYAVDCRDVADQGGDVLELHCYAVPDDIQGDTIQGQLLQEAAHYLPALHNATVTHADLMVKDDFAAFHVGCDQGRPETRTAAPGLYLAGDWVKLPVPAMLMEGAVTSGLYAANAILEAAGARQTPVDSVPLRGLMAGMRGGI